MHMTEWSEKTEFFLIWNTDGAIEDPGVCRILLESTNRSDALAESLEILHDLEYYGWEDNTSARIDEVHSHTDIDMNPFIERTREDNKRLEEAEERKELARLKAKYPDG